MATPTGTVQINQAQYIFGSITLADDGNGNGIGSFVSQPNTLTPGTYNLTATYSGDANYNGFTTPVLVQVVNSDPTKLNVTMTFTSSLNPSLPESTVTFSVSVTPAS